MADRLNRGAYKLPCGCLIERGTEHILKQCHCCESEYTVRHAAAMAERAPVFIESGDCDGVSLEPLAQAGAA